jgi:hypothetical protein
MVKYSPSLIKDCEAETNIFGLVPPVRSSLARLMRLSKRSRAWFRVLRWEQRRFLDAVIRTVDHVVSPFLLRVLEPLVKRLLVAVGGDVRRGALALNGIAAHNIMVGLAKKLVGFGEAWGNKNARQWLSEDFVRYLVVMNLPQNGNLDTLMV